MADAEILLLTMTSECNLGHLNNDDHEKDGVDVERKAADVVDLLLDVLFDDVSNFFK